MVAGLITKNDVKVYVEEVQSLFPWCQANNLLPKCQQDRLWMSQENSALNGTTFRYVSEDVWWTLHIPLQHSRQCNVFIVYVRIIQNIQYPFYTASAESILTENIAAWYGNCSAENHKALQWVVRSAEQITRSALPRTSIPDGIDTIRTWKILKDPTQPNSGVFECRQPGKCLCNHMARAEMLKRSFFPQVIRPLNSWQSTPAHGIHTHIHTWT